MKHSNHLNTHWQDALLACGEAAKLFIHYIASTANDNCKDAKRQTISAGACRPVPFCAVHACLTHQLVTQCWHAAAVLFFGWPAGPALLLLPNASHCKLLSPAPCGCRVPSCR